MVVRIAVVLCVIGVNRILGGGAIGGAILGAVVGVAAGLLLNMLEKGKV